jgi:WD40 repeat protein
MRRDGPATAAGRVLEMVPGARPLAALAAHLAHLAGAGAPSPADLAADERTLDVATARALDGRPADERVLLVVDQLEEAFTLCSDEGERAAFLGNLVDAATIPGGRTVVVATMRADFYHRLAEHPTLRGLVASQQVLLGPLDARNLRRAIEEPARRCGLDLEPGLTRRILTDVADRPGTLPLLEHLLLELWRRRRDHTLTLEAYGASGGVEGALARRANEIYGAMDPERQAIARRVLLRLTQPGEGTEDTRRRATRTELVTDPTEHAEVDTVVESLADARLVTTGVDDATGEPVVEVTHEALIRGWPELRRWIDEDRDRLRAERRLADAAAEWDRSGRDDGALYRGARLLWWAERDTSPLNPVERAFLAASEARAERERVARRRRVRYTIAGLSVALAAIAAVAVFALVQRNDATDQRDLATSRQLAGSSTLARQGDPELATLLGVSAYAASPTVEAEESLRQAVHDSRIRAALRIPDEQAVSAVAMPGGRVAVVTAQGNFRVWDPAKDPHGASSALIGTWPAGVDGLAATPAGYVTGGTDGAIVLFPGRDAPGPPEPVARVKGRIYYVNAVPGRDQVTVTSESGAYLVGVRDHRVQPIPDGFRDAVAAPAGNGYYVVTGPGGLEHVGGSSAPTPIRIGAQGQTLAVSPDGTLLAVGTAAGLEVFRLGRQPTRVFASGDPDGVNDIAWSPDSSLVETAGGSGAVRIFDRTGRLLSVLIGHSGSALGAAWNGPTSAVSVGTDGSVREWDATAGAENRLPGRTPAFTGGIAFDAKGSQITVVGADSSVERWTPGRSVTAPVLPAIPGGSAFSAQVRGGLVAAGVYGTAGGVVVRDASGHVLADERFPNNSPQGVALDPRNRRVAAALSPSGRVVTIDLTPGAKARTVGRHAGGAFAVAFSPDGGTLASGGQDGSVKVWGGPGGSRTLGTHDGQVSSVAFSPDGRWLASSGGDKTVRVWDLTGEEPVRIIRSHQDAVWAVTFAGDDRTVSGGSDAVRVTDWRRGVTLLTIPEPANGLTVAGPAPAIAWYGNDNVIHEIACDVCGPIESVQAAARQRTARGLTEAEKTDFHVEG